MKKGKIQVKIVKGFENVDFKFGYTIISKYNIDAYIFGDDNKIDYVIAKKRDIDKIINEYKKIKKQIQSNEEIYVTGLGDVFEPDEYDINEEKNYVCFTNVEPGSFYNFKQTNEE